MPTIPLYIFAGQSNMVGRYVGETPTLPGVYSYTDGSADLDAYLGPNFGFARALQLAGAGEIAIVRTAMGLTSLRPRTAKPDWSPTSTGELYDQMLATVYAALRDLMARGYTVEIKALFWMQGESDSATIGQAAQYVGLFRQFAADLRARLEDQTLPIYTGEILARTDVAGNAVLRASQQTLANTDDFVSLIHTEGFEQYDAAHLTESGAYRLGEAFAAEYLGYSPLSIIDGTGDAEQLASTPNAPEVYAGAGNDTVTGSTGADLLFGEQGDDVLSAGPGNDLLFGGNDNDTLHGEAGDDRLYGGYGDDLIEGGRGHDFLSGGLGNDRLEGGAGIDRLDGGEGDNILDGGAGNDSYFVAGTGDTVVEAAGGGTDTVWASLGRYSLGANVENLRFTSDTSHVGTGNTLANRLIGGAGVDRLSGGRGNDVLSGGAGADILVGGSGRDTLIGAAGADLLSGSADADTFVYASVSQSPRRAFDTITDFSAAEGDRIDLSGIDTNFTNDTFVFIGGDTFSGRGGELRFSRGLLAADVNGDGITDLAVKLENTTTLASSSLIL